MQATSTKERAFLWDYGGLLIAIGGCGLGVFIAMRSSDAVMSFHGAIFAVAGLAAAILFLRKPKFSLPIDAIGHPGIRDAQLPNQIIG